MEKLEYIITVSDPKIWDEIWEVLTTDGLSDNYIPDRGVEVANDRPFNDFCAHFYLTDEEAIEIAKDPRIESVELKGDLQRDVKKGHCGVRNFKFDKSNVTTADMKNWGLLRCLTENDPFMSNTSLTSDYTYNLDGTGVDIIVIDTGVDPDHPEFAVNADGTGGSRVVDFNWASLGVSGIPSSASIGGYLGDSDGHGSNCASIAAGNTCGWASGAAIYSIRIFGGNDIRSGATLGVIDSDYAYDLVRAFHLQKISQGNTRPTVCTNSWGYSTSYDGMQYTVYRGTQYNITTPNSAYGQVNSSHPYSINYVNTSVNNAAAAGVIMVGAAGNYYHKIDVPGGSDYNNYYFWQYSIWSENIYYHRGMSPTNASSMICVGAISNSVTEQKATFSETGPRVDLYAPGALIMGAYANAAYATNAVPDSRNQAHYLNKISGTSQATPQVSGVIACLLQLRPNLTNDQVKTLIINYASSNKLVVTGTESYSNQRSLQGGNNRILKMPFSNPIRGLLGKAT